MLDVSTFKGYLDALQTAENALAVKRADPTNYTLDECTTDLAAARAAWVNVQLEFYTLYSLCYHFENGPSSLIVLP